MTTVPDKRREPVSTPDNRDRPLNDEEIAALEFFLDGAVPKGFPSMVRRLLVEVRERRAAESTQKRGPDVADGWPLDESSASLG
jgi:hypothetical protein